MYKLNRERNYIISRLTSVLGGIQKQGTHYWNYIKCISPLLSPIPYFLLLTLQTSILFLVSEWLQGTEKVVVIVGTIVIFTSGVFIFIDIHSRIRKVRRELQKYRHILYKTYREVFNMDKNG